MTLGAMFPSLWGQNVRKRKRIVDQETRNAVFQENVSTYPNILNSWYVPTTNNVRTPKPNSKQTWLPEDK